MELSWLIVTIAVLVGLTMFLVVELFKLARRVKWLTECVAILMRKDTVMMTELTKLFVRAGWTEGVKDKDGNCFFIPPDLSTSAKRMASQLGEPMQKGGGSRS